MASSELIQNARLHFGKIRFNARACRSWLPTLAWLAQGWGVQHLFVSQNPKPGMWLVPWLSLAVLTTWRPRTVVAGEIKQKGLVSLTRHVLEAGWMSAAFGGLGMVIGTCVDQKIGAMNYHGHAEHSSNSLWSWATLFMLVLCLPVCIKYCGDRTQMLQHIVVGLVAMFIGMLAGGAVLGEATSRLVHSVPLGVHIAMLVGMGVGTSVSALLFSTKQ